MNAAQHVFLKEKFEIKCECAVWRSEPWQVGLLHT